MDDRGVMSCGIYASSFNCHDARRAEDCYSIEFAIP
jgi:hypothetical protein